MFDHTMMERLQKAQEEIENAKQRLENMMLEASSPSDKVKVTISAAKKITGVRISPDLLNADMEELEDHIVMALNNAISLAEQAWESEMKSAASGLMPGI